MEFETNNLRKLYHEKTETLNKGQASAGYGTFSSDDGRGAGTCIGTTDAIAAIIDHEQSKKSVRGHFIDTI